MATSLTATAAWADIVPRWQRYAPPARPSADDVSQLAARMDRIIQDSAPGARVQVLVLGATPEIRTMLAARPEAAVTVFDNVLPMMLAMTSLVDAPDLDEVWIKGDWLTAPLPDRYFDAVLCDLVLGNLSPADQGRLLRRVHGCLKPGGSWISRFDCVDGHSVIEDFDVLLERYARVPDPTQEDICSLRSVAGLRFWDPATRFLSYSGLEDAVCSHRDRAAGRFVHPDPAANQVLERLWEVIQPGGRPYWLSYKADLYADLGEWFDISYEHRDTTFHLFQGRGYYHLELQPVRQPVAAAGLRSETVRMVGAADLRS